MTLAAPSIHVTVGEVAAVRGVSRAQVALAWLRANPVLAARRGEVVRFFLTNTANARVFNVALPGARMKLVGGDSVRVEREAFVDSVILAPSERVVVDVLFAQPGQLTL